MPPVSEEVGGRSDAGASAGADQALLASLPEPASGLGPAGDDPSRKPKPCLLDLPTLVRDLRACANGMRSFKSAKGDYGICDDAADAVEWADWQRRYAIEWANRSVDSVKERMWALEDCLRGLEAYLRNTPHHNAVEAAAARKILRDRDEHPEGEDPKGLSGEAMPARAEGIAPPLPEQSS